MNSRQQRPARAVLATSWAPLIVGMVAGALFASPVRIFQAQGPTGFLAGTFEGVRLDDAGALTLAAEREQVRRIAEPFAYSFATLPDGWAVGTGNDGKVLRVGRDGQVSELFDAPEPDIFALWADPDGTIFAGSSPGGKVYRIRSGAAEVYFDPQATYIWAIARDVAGVLWVATGVEGKLYRVKASGQGEVAWDSNEPHLRSLLPLPGGDLLIGTVGEGRVVRRAVKDGGLSTLYDSSLAEVVSLARSSSGAIYAAVLASESSFVDLEPKAKSEAPTPDAKSEEATVTVETEGTGATGAMAAGTRAAGSQGPRSELVRLLDAGISESLWSSQDETLFALSAEGERVWMATGAEGRLYSYFDGSVRFEQKFDERQIVGLLPGTNGPDLLTTNEAALYRTLARAGTSGTFTSSVADAALSARFGLFRWTGERPDGTALRVSLRGGTSSVPDDSWSDWSPPIALGGAIQGEIAVPESLVGRFVQWRLELAGDKNRSAPRVSSAELSYRQINQRPSIDRFGAMEPGQILVPANFNPADQVYEPATPNRDGLFVPLAPSTGGADSRSKTLWKRGMRTLRWRATDPNGDELRAALSLRSESADGMTRPWMPVADDLKEDAWGFDASAIPDGRYRFRLEVTDRKGNPDGEALSVVEESDPVVIDHSPPARRGIDRRGGSLRLEIADDWNPLRQAQISIDAGEWRDLVPNDGLLDGRSETFSLDALPREARFVLFRVMDAAWNSTTFDLSQELAR